MSQARAMMLTVVLGVVGSTGECQAQVGFGVVQNWVSSGARMNVQPVVTNGGRYVRMGVSVSFSQVVDVQTFSPVHGYPGLLPVNPIGFGLIGSGLDSGVGGRRRGGSAPPPIQKPASSRFVEAAWKFDTDKNARLSRDEIEKLATAVITELKRSPAVYRKLERGAGGDAKAGKAVGETKVVEAFVEQCLKYDRNKDGLLNPSETDVLALALVRFLK